MEAGDAGTSGVGRSCRPQLLVSVRCVAEARAALAGGCDILDVKEPGRGALGMADPDTMAHVLRVAGAAPTAAAVPVTAALGETSEWVRTRAVPWLPAGLSAVKLGLAGLGAVGEDWISAWRSVRDRFQESSAGRLSWIAVIYADWSSAKAPPPEAIVEAAIATGCAGVLFDTHAKDGRHLLDWLELEEIKRLAASAQASGLLAALAGSLTAALLPALGGLRPDVIAVRGAVCAGGSRTGVIAPPAVRILRAGIKATWGGGTTQERSVKAVRSPRCLSVAGLRSE
jgi:uncharacterized protein (UPF0264 family)